MSTSAGQERQLIERWVRTEPWRLAEALQDRVRAQEVAVAETRCRLGQDV